MLNVPYCEQLVAKDAEIRSLFSDLVDQGDSREDVFRTIAGMDDPFHYRDKVIAPFVPGKAGGRRNHKGDPKGRRGARPNGILTGMYASRTHKVIESDGCVLENPIASKVVNAVKSIMLKHGIEPYCEDSGLGFMRHVVVRVGHNSGEVLVALVTNCDDFPHSKSFCRELVKRVPEITSIVQSVNTRQTNVVMGDKFHTLYGPGFILDELCGLSFRISPGAFYQVNSTQTEVLYELAMQMAGLSGGETALDAYCGTGTIGLVAASRGAKRLIGVDSSRQAISDARQNARHNGIASAEFAVGDATEFMLRTATGEWAFRAEGPKGDLVLFLDPPRSGATDGFLDAAVGLSPSRIVYISCNPKTQVRDAQRLVEGGYEIAAIQPVDMFPHTPHIENIALFKKASAR